jgi:hypothetical protein
MERKKILPFILVGTLALAAILGITAYKSVQASAPGATNIIAAFFGRGPQGETSDADLAAALGITADKLTAAYATATDAALKEAVTKGLITQTQADQFKTRTGSGGDFGLFAKNGVDYHAFLANALGITVEKLQAAYLTAFNAGIDRAVTSGKLTQAQADSMKGRYALSASARFQSAMQTAFQAAVQQAVTDGTITQAQADEILKNSAGAGFGLEGRGGMGGFEKMGGKHGGMGGPGGKGPEGGFGGRPGRGGNGTNPAAPQPTPSGGA